MELEARAKVKLALLNEEWRNPSCELFVLGAREISDSYGKGWVRFRNERLEKIRSELAQLRSELKLTDGFRPILNEAHVFG